MLGGSKTASPGMEELKVKQERYEVAEAPISNRASF